MSFCLSPVASSASARRALLSLSLGVCRGADSVGMEHFAFNRTPLARPDLVMRANAIHGDNARLHRKLISGLPVTIAAIGTSNVVRGGCSDWQHLGRCYRKSSSLSDGLPRPWLLQAFTAMNRTWPHPGHRLINHGVYASGPEGPSTCLNQFVPEDVDAVIIGYADRCDQRIVFRNSTFGLELEATVRQLLLRPDSPTLVMWNFWKAKSYWCRQPGQKVGPQHPCSYHMTCEIEMNELAMFYGISAISFRNAFFLDTRDRRVRKQLAAYKLRNYPVKDFTVDDGGHFDFLLGDMLAAEILFSWIARASLAHSGPKVWALPQPTTRLDLVPQQWYTSKQQTGALKAMVPALCYSFEDDFYGTVAPPVVLQSESPGFEFIQYEYGHSGEQKVKPGWIANRTGSRLRVALVKGGSRMVSVGYLRSWASKARFMISCVPPCSCSESRIETKSLRRITEGVKITKYSPFFRVESPSEMVACNIDLTVTKPDKQRFKFIALRVSITANGSYA